MKVYGLEGRSGSGKSYQATGLCRKLKIESILDDGIFISGGRILAGVSAKRQTTRVRAIKTALFTEEWHKDEVARKIREIGPASILVIGTSEKMVERITDRLGLPKADEIISIESITTAAERALAGRQRNELGKHVIPVPTFQLKKDFSGYFMHPLRMLWDMRGGRARGVDRSVVRPSFSYMGKYTISNRAISDIAAITGSDVGGVGEILKITAEHDETGMAVNAAVTLSYGVSIMGTALAFQQRVADQIERMTAININAVNVEVRGLQPPSPQS
ncbi:MAG: Asp23/Gls24 family envelope stress response protein [Clostridiales Family XIII bacterium]|jgi:uncharacterized alkaline shock family protein YloU|nr:Asp23/Gls24 family envelope stress response protein [Clostridiales Family XIII bacterium]